MPGQCSRTFGLIVRRQTEQVREGRDGRGRKKPRRLTAARLVQGRQEAG